MTETLRMSKRSTNSKFLGRSTTHTHRQPSSSFYRSRNCQTQGHGRDGENLHTGTRIKMDTSEV